MSSAPARRPRGIELTSDPLSLRLALSLRLRFVGWKDKTTTQTTLHLTHLPPNLTSPQLTLIFSSYAPLRSAFVVSTSTGPKAGPVGSSANAIATGPGRERTGKSTSRGFGYVRFVLRTDADKCIEEWGGKTGIPRSAVKDMEGAEGLENVEWDKLCGRDGMKMGWAKKKLKEGEVAEGPKEKREKKPKVERAVPEDVEEEERQPKWRPGIFDHAAARTVIVQGIPLPLTEEEIAAEKAAKAAKMDVDGEDEDGEKEDEKEEEEEAKDGEDGEGEDEGESGKAVDWKKAIKQKAKKSGDVEDVKWPVVLPSGESVGEWHLDLSALSLR